MADMPQLVRDQSGGVLQALTPQASVNLTLSASTQRLTLPTNTSIVRIATTADCYVAFGGASVTATTSDMLFPIGAEIFAIIDDDITHVAVVGVAATSAVFSATKML